MTNKQKGILFLVGPFAGLVGSLALYGLFASMLGNSNFRISQILKIVFGFIGMVKCTPLSRQIIALYLVG